MFFNNQGFLIFAIPFYQMTLGLDPFLLSLCSVLPMIIATSLKPWIGHLSDRLYSRYGRRKPFLLCSSIFSGICYGALWSVPIEWSDTQTFIYLGTLSLLFHIAGSFYNIPLKCLTFEASDNSLERTRIIAISNAFSKACGLAQHWIFPIAQLAIFSSIFAGVQIIGWVIGIVFITVLGIFPVLLANEKPQISLEPDVDLATKFKVVSQNYDFLYLMIFVLFIVFGIGGLSSLDYYLLVYFVSDGDISQGAILKGALSSAYALAGIAYIPIILWSVKTIGKISTLRYIFILAIIGGACKWFLFEPGIGWWIILDAIFSNFVWVGNALIIPALLADICSKQADLSDFDSKGIFISMHSWVSHISKAGALLCFGIVLNIVAFDATKGAIQDESTILSMRLLLSGGTMLVSSVLLFMLFKTRLRSL